MLCSGYELNESLDKEGIIELNKKSVKGKILREERILNEQKYSIHLALPLIKNNRFYRKNRHSIGKIKDSELLEELRITKCSQG